MVDAITVCDARMCGQGSIGTQRSLSQCERLYSQLKKDHLLTGNAAVRCNSDGYSGPNRQFLRQMRLPSLRGGSTHVWALASYRQAANKSRTRTPAKLVSVDVPPTHLLHSCPRGHEPSLRLKLDEAIHSRRPPVSYCRYYIV